MKGKIHFLPYQYNKKNGSIHSVQCMFGKGLVYAYEKAESQNWAGTVVDETVVNDLSSDLEFLDDIAVQYEVPYKKRQDIGTEYVLRIGTGIRNEVALANAKKNVETVFAQDNKSISSESVREKIINTQNFIQHIKEF